MTIPQISIILFICGILGLIGIKYKFFFLNTLFAYFNILFYSIIFITFYLNNDAISISAGNYAIDMFGAILLLIAVNKAKKTYERLKLDFPND
jgi:hypothetical protein